MAGGFSALASRAVGRLQPPPVVGPAEYAAITCNRCGLCCEDIRVDKSPQQLAAEMADETVDEDRHRFLAGLQPVARVAGGWRYRCEYFARDTSGLGTCTVHETRPAVCRGYPYGGVVRAWPACAWYVRVEPVEVQRVNL